MDYLWSPWRYNYVSTASSVPPGPEACLFCRVITEARDRENYVVYRGNRNFIILNRYPYSTGHVLIAPYEHVSTLEAAGPESLQELILLAQKMEMVLRAIYRPNGMNLGFNIGESAGAGIAGHIHMHVLPRWSGDTSFVTTVSETRVLPEDLETTYDKLSAALQSA